MKLRIAVTVFLLVLSLGCTGNVRAEKIWGADYPAAMWMKLSLQQRQLFVMGTLAATDYMMRMAGKRLVAKGGNSSMSSPQVIEQLVYVKLVENDILRTGPVLPVIIVVMAGVLETWEGGVK